MKTIKDLGELQIKTKIASNWFETKDGFTANNLVIYYDESINEWRLIDTSALSAMDFITIKIPLDYEEVVRIKRICSEKQKN